MKSSVLNRLNKAFNDTIILIEDKNEEIKQLNLSSVKTAIENDRLVNKLKKGLNNAINEI